MIISGGRSGSPRCGRSDLFRGLTAGPHTAEFEETFAKYVGAKHALAVSLHTPALHLALEATRLKATDEMLGPQRRSREPSTNSLPIQRCDSEWAGLDAHTPSKSFVRT
jgi:hypothetical protein